MKVKHFLRLKWLKRKPKVTYIVCPRCQRQARGDAKQLAVQLTTNRYTPDPVYRRVSQQAMDAAVAVDDFRRQKAGGDPLRDRALADIEAGFMQNVADIGRKLRRSGGQDEQS